ncbi:MAG: cytochrome P450 [Paludibacteraceae bacterium]|nr:cytochrome P450 [Paludibacteraceae bacterium]
MRIAFKTLLVLTSVFLVYMCYRSIMNPIEFDREKAVRDKAVIAKLIDIRKAQIAYKDAKGVYTDNFDTLLHFIKEDSVMMISKKGELTDEQLEKGLTEEIAVALTEENAAQYGIEDYYNFKENFRRDTSYVSVLVNLYGEGYNVDSLAYVPYLNNVKFEMETGDNKTKSGIVIPLFEARTPYKTYLEGMDRQEIINLTKQAIALGKYEGLKVGDKVNPNNNAGNWE